ncbi:hypothetical protein PtA15_5A463 [Puccinia triticina]|uniref:LCCL domain-containing protein n=1 Tax=Puccinia triticina TaxID=208348 RepID=A0ABY7CM54_9BASI|nr:uncharacterized protein PtA15_5A463 [Puccinia triticina]WAQ84890.1 hypothetical protein PtA15_5A463 [Puccinia triticina]
MASSTDSLVDEHSLSPISHRTPLLPRHASDSDDEVYCSQTSRAHQVKSYIKQATASLRWTVQPFLPTNPPHWLQTTRPLSLPTVNHRSTSQAVFLGIWLLVNLALIRQSWSLSNISEPSHFPQPTKPEWLHCVESYWLKDDGCGLNGKDCSSYRNVTMAFRCPSHCGTSTGLLNPRVVGGEVANYQPLVVGGGGQGKRYRPDSFICQSAVHAGIVSARWGGCGVLKMLDETHGFSGSEANGIRSIGFPAPFPMSFTFLDNVHTSGCNDLWLTIILLNVACSAIFVLLLGPSPQMFFWVLSIVGYWIVPVASEPSSLPPSWSKATGNFLPFLFVCYWLWNVCWRDTLETISSLDRVWVYLGPWWFGVLMNLTAGWVPLDRLTPHDLQQRPGAFLALSILMTITAILVYHQACCLRKEKRFEKLAVPYAFLAIVLILLCFVPEHSLRIHHYLIGIFLSPLASAKTKISGVLQGFLLGMVQNGVARWSFASILEQTSEVIGDGYLSGDSMPEFDLEQSGLINGLKDLKVSWKSEGPDDRASLVGVMVNDVLRFIVPKINQSLIIHNFLNNLTSISTSPSPLQAAFNQVFFRLAFFDNKMNAEHRISEYTGPVTFFVNNQTWLGPTPVY